MFTKSNAHLRITGFKHHEVVETIFASLMVDIAYVIEASEQQILVIGEEPENRSIEYKTWLKLVTVETLNQKGLDQLVVEILSS